MALSPDEKKIYLNQDTAAGEADGAMYFPVKYLTGLESTTNATVTLYFRGPNNTTSTSIIVLITADYIKEFYTQFVNEINFGDKAVITLAVKNLSVSTTQGGSDFVYVNAFAGAIVSNDDSLGYEDLQIAEDLDVGGKITIGSNAELAPALVMDNDENQLKIGVSNGTNTHMTGSADGDVVIHSVGDHNVLIGQNDAVALTIDTDGAVALATDLAVAHGGTGASTLTDNGVLFGNGTSAISAVDLSSNGNIIVGGSTPAAVTGANLAGSGLAATVGDGTLVLAVETLNQDTTGTAAGLSATLAVGSGGTGLTTVAANTILTGNGTSALTAETDLTYDGSELNVVGDVIVDGDITANSFDGLWDGGAITVAKGGTGLTTVAVNTILTGNGTSALTAETNLTFSANRLHIGADDEITPQVRFQNDENTVTLGISDTADNLVVGSADGDFVIGNSGDHNVLITQNNEIALTVDTNGDSNFNRRFTITGVAGTYEGDVVYFGGTTSMTLGKIYHYKSDGTWELANADDASTCDGLLAVALGAASDTNGMLLRGMVTLDHDPGTIGDVLYVQSDNAGTPGNATATAPSASGDCVRVIGYQIHHTSAGNIWFNPDGTFVEVA
jgi:hypothetical protein